MRPLGIRGAIRPKQWSIWTSMNTRANCIQNGGLAYIGNYYSYLSMVH